MKKLTIVRNVFLWMVLVLIAASCVPSKPVEEEQVLPADRLVKKIEANRRKIKTFKGTGILSIESPEFDARGSFEILLKKPDTVKVSIFGPFGIDLAQSFVTKNDFMFYDMMNNNLYTGKVEAEVLKKIFKVDFSFEDLMDAFTGSVNLTDKLRNEPDMYRILDDGYVLTYVDSASDKESVYKIQSNDLAIVNYRLVERPKEILFEGRYSDFKDYLGIPIPFTTTIDYYKKNQKVKIEYRNVEVNNELGNLKLVIPSDVNIIKW